jgi:hypothetical protein
MTAIQIKIPVLLDLCLVWPVLLLRRLTFGHPYRKIPLGEGRFAIVDPLIFYSLNKFHWTGNGKGDCIYAVRHAVFPHGTRILRMHREIMKAAPGVLVDHKNLNALDNRLANLRLATREQNMHNRRKTRRNASSRLVGVFLEKDRNVFRVNLTYEGKKIYIGRFHSEIDAARAHDRAALKYYGEFARLNFPREDYVNDFPLVRQKAEVKNLSNSYCEALTFLGRLKAVIFNT